MRSVILFAFITVSALTPAAAADNCRDSGSPMCSRTFYGAGTCAGGDQLVALKDGSPEVTANLLVPPWENEAISIIGIEVVIFETPRYIAYVYAGNASSPNQMMWMGPQQTHDRVFYSNGLGFRVAPIGTPGHHHIDLHISCTGGPFQLYYTLYYTMPPTIKGKLTTAD